MGTNSRRVTGGTAITVGQVHVIRAVFSGLDTDAPGSGQGTVQLFLDTVLQGDATPHSGNLHTASRGINYIGNNSASNSFDGLIYSIDITGDSYDYQFDAETSSHAGGGQPVLASSADTNNFTGNNFPTDGSAWVEEGGDVTPPAYTVAPNITDTSSTGHTISQTLNEDGTVYGVRLASGATAPTPAQIKAGQDANGDPAPEARSVAATGAANCDLVFSTGTISTLYDYHVISEDNVPNLQTTPTVLSGTTGAVSLTVTGGVLRPGQAFQLTYAGIPDLNSPVTMEDSQGNTIDVAITDNGDGTADGVMPSFPNTGTQDSMLFGPVTVTGTPVP